MLLNVISTLSQQESEKIYERLIYSETKQNGKKCLLLPFSAQHALIAMTITVRT